MRSCADKIKCQIITLYISQIFSHFVLINKRNLNATIDVTFIYFTFNVKERFIANIKIVFFIKISFI